MHRKVLSWGLLFAGIAVMLGAFGAHTLKSIVPADKVIIFETGIRYQLMHALALNLLSLYIQQNLSINIHSNGIKWSARFFLLGILCFSGSLYLLSLQSICSYPYAKFVGPITPLGGLFFMLGWANWVRVVWLHKVDK